MPRRRVREWRWAIGVLVVILTVVAICMRIVIVRAQPILRSRVIETLSTRFKNRVDLPEIHVWVANGVHVSGYGLKIFGATDPNAWEPGVQPLLEIEEFHFQTALRNLFREPMHVDTVYLTGLTMNMPPKSDRQQIDNLRRSSGRMSIMVDRFVCTDTKLIINSTHPTRAPMEFDISDLRMNEVGPGLPLRFDATLVNPKPVGDIQSTGQFGPLNEESPRDSAVRGTIPFRIEISERLRGSEVSSLPSEPIPGPWAALK